MAWDDYDSWMPSEDVRQPVAPVLPVRRQVGADLGYSDQAQSFEPYQQEEAQPVQAKGASWSDFIPSLPGQMQVGQTLGNLASGVRNVITDSVDQTGKVRANNDREQIAMDTAAAKADADAYANSALGKAMAADPYWKAQNEEATANNSGLLTPAQMEAIGQGEEYGHTASPFDTKSRSMAPFMLPSDNQVASEDTATQIGDLGGAINSAQSAQEAAIPALQRPLSGSLPGVATTAPNGFKGVQAAEAVAPAAAEQVLAQVAPDTAKMDRNKLLASAGINVEANDKADAAKANAISERESMKNAYDDAIQKSKSGDPLTKLAGLQAMSQLEQEGLAKGYLTNESGATKQLQKKLNDPYFVRDVNMAQAAQANAQAQAQAQSDRSQKQSEQSKTDARNEAADKRAEESLALQKNQQAFNQKTEAEKEATRQKERGEDINTADQRTKEQQDFDLKKIDSESAANQANTKAKLDQVFAEKDKDERAQLQYRANNQIAGNAEQAVRNAAAEYEKSQGIVGRLSDWWNGSNPDARAQAAIDAAHRLSDKSINADDEVARVKGLPPATRVPWDDDAIRSAILRAKPKSADEMAKIINEVSGVGKTALQFGTPIGRAATVFGGLGGNGNAQSLAPFLMGANPASVPSIPAPFNYSGF